MSLVYDRAADLVRSIYDRRIVAPPVLDTGTYFAGTGAFLRNWRAIREEALAVAQRLQSVPRFHEIMPEQETISANDKRDWRMLILKAYGTEWRDNMAACPRLAEVVRSTPDVLSASLSFLAPGKHIPAHRGPFRGILRFFLVLSMPLTQDGRPASALRIADRQYRLHDGDCLLWDDTYEHEVWNDSDEVRIVLLLDVWRNGMPADMRFLSGLIVQVVRAGAWIRGFGG
ncbi:MAG TPA: aspartyl/asparaginyl beta-hydroxylase domain-containing protein [Stellaceae bacterium]|nr:aspartyl/asparaginyl beta-hydroxylase domain-containing protein [Stellaceae bacterium]